MTAQRILIARIGNIFLGDDAFGVEVAQRMALLALPEGVRVVDFGIRGFDLAYALLDGYDAAIMVDVTPRGGAPGTLYLIEPDLDALDNLGAPVVETHNLDPVEVCGGHTHTIYKHGIEDVLPRNIDLVHGMPSRCARMSGAPVSCWGSTH